MTIQDKIRLKIYNSIDTIQRKLKSPFYFSCCSSCGEREYPYTKMYKNGSSEGGITCNTLNCHSHHRKYLKSCKKCVEEVNSYIGFGVREGYLDADENTTWKEKVKMITRAYD